MRHRNYGEHPDIRDYGCEPLIFNINHATNKNENFRTTLWTGRYMQLTLMSIPICSDIGVEMHSNTIICDYILDVDNKPLTLITLQELHQLTQFSADLLQPVE